jgi:hypothetical protein
MEVVAPIVASPPCDSAQTLAKRVKANGKQEELFAARLAQARSIMPGWKVKSISNKHEWPRKACPMKAHLMQAAQERDPAVPNLKTAQEYVNWLSKMPPEGVATSSSSSLARTVTLINADGNMGLEDDSCDEEGIFHFFVDIRSFFYFILFLNIPILTHAYTHTY